MQWNDEDVDMELFLQELHIYHKSLNQSNLDTRVTLLDPNMHIVHISPKQKSHMLVLLNSTVKMIKKYPVLLYDSWKMLFFHEKYKIENNYPHTIGDVILLPYPKFFTSYNLSKQFDVLLHERIHVVQRKRPDMMRRVSTKHYGLTILGTCAQYSDPNELQNPDVDDYVYADADGRLPKQTLIPPELAAHPLEHVNVPVHKMHPYERMAYELTHYFMYEHDNRENPFEKYLKTV